MKLALLWCGGCFFQPPVMQHWSGLWASPFPWDWAVQRQIALDISGKDHNGSSLAWARSHQQHGSEGAFSHGWGAEEDAACSIIWDALTLCGCWGWGASGDIILHFTRLLGLLTTITFQPPAQDSRTPWDRPWKDLYKTRCWTRTLAGVECIDARFLCSNKARREESHPRDWARLENAVYPLELPAKDTIEQWARSTGEAKPWGHLRRLPAGAALFPDGNFCAGLSSATMCFLRLLPSFSLPQSFRLFVTPTEAADY